MRPNHAIGFALLLAACDGSRPERSPRLEGTVWVSPLAPTVVDTLAFEGGGAFRWYSAELELSNTGSYRRSGDTLFLDERLSADATEEERGQGPGRYRFVVRDTMMELVFVQFENEATPATEFDSPIVFTRRPPAGSP